jgi:hypothetical protein
MSVWCSYTQPGFIPTPGWWFLVGQPYPNDSPQAELNVYSRSKRELKNFSSPTSSGHPPFVREHRPQPPKYQQYRAHYSK